MNPLDQLYQDLILQHSKERHGSGSLSGTSYNSHQVNPTCGDEVTLELSVENGKIKGMVWDGSGCAISQASLSIMHDMVEGKDVAEAASLYQDFMQMMHSRGKEVSEEVLDHLEDASVFEGTAKFVNRVKCALLGWMAMHEAMEKALSGSAGSAHEVGTQHC